MSENVADHFRIDPRLDLSRGVAVTEGMGANDGDRDAGSTGMVPNTMADAATGQRRVRHASAQEDRTEPIISWTLSAEVGGQSTSDGWQERQLDDGSSLGPPHMDDLGLPIDGVEVEAKNLSRTEPVGRHDQQHGEIAFARGTAWGIERRIRLTSLHGSARGGCADTQNRGATTQGARSARDRPVTRRKRRNVRSELHRRTTLRVHRKAIR
jgi:hypothetical protein